MPEIRLVADVEIQAAAEAGKGPRSFKVVAYTGGAMTLRGFDLPVVVDLAGMSMAKSVVANLHHQPTQIVGHATETINDGSTLALRGLVSGSGTGALEFLANHDNGFPWQASIEATPKKLIEVPEGRTVKANGREFTGPVLIARKSRLYGLGFVPRGADEHTSVTVAASAVPIPVDPKGNDMDFEKWIEAMGFDAENPPTEKQKAALKLKYDAEIKAAAKVTESGKTPEVAAPAFDLDEIKAASGEHLADLEASFAEYQDSIPSPKKFADIKAAALKGARELKAKALMERWPAARFEVQAIKTLSDVKVKLIEAKAPEGPGVNSGGGNITGPVIEAALCTALGLPDVEKQFKDETLQAAHTRYRGRIGLQEMLITAAAQNGYHPRPGEKLNDGNLRDVLDYAFPPRRVRREIEASGFSTLGLSGILGNVANKMLLSGYMEEDQTWREMSRVVSKSNFYQHTHYRMLDNMEYEELGPGGSIKHGTVDQESYTSDLRTYAKMFAIERTAIINDDLGALDDLRNRIGRGAAKKFNNLFWTQMLASHNTFFTTTRGNYITGATTTLVTDGVGLGLAVKAFRTMKTPATAGSDDGGKRVGGQPVVLFVPPELEAAADTLYRNTNLGTVASSSANIYANKYRPVVVPWLSDSNFTGYSTTAWYLFRAPTDAPMMLVSFLNGQAAPTVESADADFNTLGIQIRGYHDFYANQAEYLCGVKSKGAA